MGSGSSQQRLGRPRGAQWSPSFTTTLTIVSFQCCFTLSPSFQSCFTLSPSFSFSVALPSHHRFSVVLPSHHRFSFALPSRDRFSFALPFRDSFSVVTQLLRPTAIFQCCFTSSETVRTIREGEPRTSTSTLTQILSSVTDDPEEMLLT